MKYSKKKDKKIYRPGDFIKNKMSGSSKGSFAKGFNPGAFKVQHKG